MRSRWLAVPALLFLCSIGAPRAARAHLGLVDPPSRYGPDVLKTGPCGMRGGTRTDTPLVLPAGSPLEITWDEYIDHPGHFRIAFDPDGDDDFHDPVCIANCDGGADPAFETGVDPTVLMDLIPDTRGGETTVTITLPDIACDNCTLQVMQIMYDKRPYTIGGNDNYYQCIDLVLTRGDPPPPDPDAGPPPMGDDGGVLPPPPPPGDSGPVATPDGATPLPDAATRRDSGPGSTGGGGEDDGCGCGVVGAQHESLSASVLAALGLSVVVAHRVARRRRRRTLR